MWHLRAFQEPFCLAKNNNAYGSNQPEAGRAKNAAPTLLLSPNRKAKKVKSREN
jgi:hypothetical protein